MTENHDDATGPTRAEIDAMPGLTVVEFGTSWCGYCAAAQPLIRSALAGHPAVRHLKIEDAKGRPAGRSFEVRLWPTLVFLSDGKEISRVVRPNDQRAIIRALAELEATTRSDA